jgi:hypothetical protein
MDVLLLQIARPTDHARESTAIAVNTESYQVRKPFQSLVKETGRNKPTKSSLELQEHPGNTKLVLNGEFAGLMGRIFCSNWLQFL